MSLDDFPRHSLLFGPSPVHPLPRLTGRIEQHDLVVLDDEPP